MKDLKTFLKTTFPKNFIYYNNPSSIKIQLPTKNEEPVINYLTSNNIKFTLEHPEYIQVNLQYIKNCTTIRIKK
jgi:hypothetical protein